MEESNKKYCMKCGAQNDVSQKFCGVCGASFDAPSSTAATASAAKRSISPKVIIIAAAALVIAAGATIGLISYNDPINKLDRALNKDDYALVCDIYYQNNKDNKFMDKAETAFEQYTADIVDKFAQGSLTSEQVNDIVNGLDGICDFSDVSDSIENITVSKSSYVSAEEYKDKEEYTEAINYYKKVVEEDIENFENAKNNITECEELYSSKVISDADKAISDSEKADGYVTALTMLQSAKKTGYTNDKVDAKIDEVTVAWNEAVCSETLEKAQAASSALDAYKIIAKVPMEQCTDEFKTKADEYLEKSVAEVKDSVKKLTDKKDYGAAYTYLQDLPVAIKNETDIKTLTKDVKDNYVSGKLAEAKTFADKENYSEAISVIEDAAKNVYDAKLTSKKSEYQEQYIKSVKDYFVKKEYDDFNHVYGIFPYPENYYQDYGYEYTTRPDLLIYDIGKVYFRISMGFTKYDWIFMNKIIIDCDGQQFNFSVDYGDRDTNVFGGKVTEKWLVIHDTSFNYDSQYVDLTKMMTAIENAKSVKIRFSGTDGHYDYEISRSEINKLAVYWKTYNILEHNMDLKKYVIN